MSTHSTHQFAEKVALITDVSDPIGRAVAMQLSLNGAFVVAGFPPGSDPDATIEDMLSLGTLASAAEADLTNVEGRSALIGEVREKFGRIDLLVNCLKFDSQSTFLELSEPKARTGITDRISAALLFTRTAHDLMVERPRARIVNVCSFVNATGNLENIDYAIVTGAVEGLTGHLSRNLPPNFRTNCVVVDTATDLSSPDGMIRPRNRIEPDDVARVVLFLLSSESGSVNGQVIRLN